MIITSRNQDWDVVAREMPILVFEEDEAVEFILKRTDEDDPESAKELAKELDWLPLALEQACAYIKTRSKSIAGYLELFRQRKIELLKFPLSRQDYDRTVATTWEISFQQVLDESEAGADLLKLCAFLAPEKIPRSLISGGATCLPEPLASAVADELKLDNAIAALKRYSLMTVADDFFSFHRLVQAVTWDRMTEEERKEWAGVAITLSMNAFPFKTDDIRTWPECSALLPHAVVAVEHAKRLKVATETTGRLLNRAGVYLGRRGELGKAKSAFEKSLAIYEEVYGLNSNNLYLALTLMNFGNILSDEGDFEGAKTSYEKVMDILEEVYGPDPSNTYVAAALMNIGNVLLHKGDLDGAKSAYEKVLAICEDVYGPDSNTPDVAGTLISLGAILRQQGDLDGAKSAYKTALAIYEEVYGPDSNNPSVASALTGLGNVLDNKGYIDEAKSAYEKALAIYDAAYGPESIHPDVAITLTNLSDVLIQKGDLDGAKAALEKALAIFLERLGKDHIHTIKAGNNLEALDH